MRRLITLVLGACALLASLLAHAGDCPVALPLDMYAQRSTYHGECANGLAHGQGRIAVVYKANGKRFAGTLSGQFAGGMPNGPGSFVTDDGQKRFDGIFRDGAMWEGRATSIDQDGTAWVDEFQGGRQVSSQPVRPAYGQRNAYTQPDDARSYQGNGYTQEQPQQPDPLSGLVSSIAQIALNSGAQALERKYQEKYGGQQVDTAQRTLEEHREIKRRNREALEAERAQRHTARENVWKQEQAQREREKVQRQAELNRQSRAQEAERARQAQADQQRFEEQRRQDEARLAEFNADRERKQQEKNAAYEQERARQQEIARQKDEARWQGAEQERIQQQEFYRQIQEDRKARLDRANQESAARQAEIERLAQQDLEQREEARRQRVENQQTLIDQPKTTESPQNTPAPSQLLSEEQKEDARQKLDRIYVEAKRIEREVALLDKVQSAPNRQSSISKAPKVSGSANEPKTLEDVLTPSEQRWLAALPHDKQEWVQSISPEQILSLKERGRWSVIQGNIAEELQTRAEGEQYNTYAKEAWLAENIAKTGKAVDDTATILTLPIGGGIKGVAGKAAGKAATELVERKAEKEVAEQAIKGVVDDVATNGTNNVGDALKGSNNPVVREALEYGQAIHRSYNYGPGFDKEYLLPSGKRIDAINFETREIVELKPNNPRAIALGRKQLDEYKREIEEIYGKGWTAKLETYDR